MYSTAEIRKKFIDYFVSKQHTQISSSSLIPANDPTLLFVNAGMVQFKDLFLGAQTQKYTRATSSQRCVRAGGKHNDLDQVGYTARHHTFFEMLGNFSFGDYFKEDAIKYAWEFLTEVLKLPKDKLLITVFEEDEEARDIWIEKMGVPQDKVLKIGAKDNFWQMGDTGPCGPCSEIFYDHGEEIAGGPPGTPEEDGDRFIEIWNLVFMQFDRQVDGELLPLPKPCVDTGMGLERISSIMQGKHNNYEIDLFQHIIDFTANLLKVKNKSDPSLKVIADHIRTCSFLICDGILPSNEGRGYVLRRIIRRAIRHGYKLGANETFFYKILAPLIDVMSDAYPELINNKEKIENALSKEERRFAETLETGMSILNNAISKLQGNIVDGAVAFKLYDTYGFPLDLTQDVAREQGLTVDTSGFQQCMLQQKQRSKASGGFTQSNQIPTDLIAKIQPTKFTGYSELTGNGTIIAIIKDSQSADSLKAGESGALLLNETPFYAESGGQVGDRGIFTLDDVKITIMDTQKGAGQFHLHIIENCETKVQIGQQVKAQVDKDRRNAIILNHSATHLLHKVLQEQLGSHVQQKGSTVACDKLRFDFSHQEAISAKQLQTIENEVNKHIRSNYQAKTELMSFDEAVKTGAMALFGEKYGDEVRVLNIGDYSIELCGGTHVENAGQIGLFKICSESSIAAGIRRIEAVTGNEAINYIQSCESKYNEMIQLLHANDQTVVTKVEQVLDNNKHLEKKLTELENKLAGSKAKDLWNNVQQHNDVNFLFEIMKGNKISNLRTIVDNFKDKYASGIIVLANHSDNDKVQLICAVGKSVNSNVRAGDVIKNIASQIDGKGGGRPDFAQGGGVSSTENLEYVMQKTFNSVKKLIQT